MGLGRRHATQIHVDHPRRAGDPPSPAVRVVHGFVSPGIPKRQISPGDTCMAVVGCEVWSWVGQIPPGDTWMAVVGCEVWSWWDRSRRGHMYGCGRVRGVGGWDRSRRGHMYGCGRVRGVVVGGTDLAGDTCMAVVGARCGRRWDRSRRGTMYGCGRVRGVVVGGTDLAGGHMYGCGRVRGEGTGNS